jgi:uncharacterized protein YbjQ (UPF0145 family)
MANAISHAMTTPTFTLDGYRIDKTLVGGDITLFTELCEKTRNDAFELMLEHATARR